MRTQPKSVESSSSEIYNYPYLHMTGHGNVYFDEEDVENLRTYLLAGGFLHIDDNYGMRPYAEEAIKKIFPDKELIELPASHAIFQEPFPFPDGLPKIHEHDGLRPQAFGLFDQDRLMLLFTVESDLGDGWEDPEIHNDPESVREQALKMGANIIHYAFHN